MLPMQSHSSHGTSHSLKPTPIGYVGNLTNSAPFTEVIPNACSRNWLRPSPWSNVGLAKIPKAFRPSGRGRSGSGLVGGGWSWQPRGVLQKLGDTQTVNLIDHGRKPRLLGLTLFIEKDMAHTFLIGVSIDTYFAHCSAGR